MEEFAKRVFAVAFTDSVHSLGFNPMAGVSEFYKKVNFSSFFICKSDVEMSFCRVASLFCLMLVNALNFYDRGYDYLLFSNMTHVKMWKLKRNSLIILYFVQ
jgi:hypothetical protein